MWHKSFVSLYLITVAITICWGMRSKHGGKRSTRKRRKEKYDIHIHLHLYDETGKQIHGHHVRGRVRNAHQQKSNITFESIINGSIDTVTHIPDITQIKYYLNTYYFTNDEKLSIWAKCVKERGIHFYKHRSKFESMQSLIKVVYVRWLNCGNFTASEQCQCYFTMHTLLQDGASEFELPPHDIVGQAILFDLHIAYNIMSLLIYHLTIHTAIFAKRPANVIRIAYLQIADNLHRDIEDVIRNVTMARLQKISDIEICNLEEILWMDYRGDCQSYDNNVYGMTNLTKKSPETIHSITGNTSVSLKRYHARVIDRANGTVVCNEYREAKSTDEHSVEIEIYKTCHFLRNRYVNRVKREFLQLHNRRTVKVREDLSTLWGRQRKRIPKEKQPPTVLMMNLK